MVFIAIRLRRFPHRFHPCGDFCSKNVRARITCLRCKIMAPTLSLVLITFSKVIHSVLSSETFAYFMAICARYFFLSRSQFFYSTSTLFCISSKFYFFYDIKNFLYYFFLTSLKVFMLAMFLLLYDCKVIPCFSCGVSFRGSLMLEISVELIKIVNFIYLFQNSVYQWITIVVTTLISKLTPFNCR